MTGTQLEIVFQIHFDVAPGKAFRFDEVKTGFFNPVEFDGIKNRCQFTRRISNPSEFDGIKNVAGLWV